MTDVMNQIDMALLEPIVKRFEGHRRDALLPMLHEAQAIYGWLPQAVQEAISQTLRVPAADVHGVIEFYTMFYNQPTAKKVIRICEGSSCHLAGSAAVIEAVESQLGLENGQTSADGSVTYELVPCLGMCEHGPNALNGTRTAGQLTAARVPEFLDGSYPEPGPKVFGSPRLALGRVGIVDPGSLEDYLAHGGYQGLGKALEMDPTTLIASNKTAEILGRGGAQFPMGVKAEMVRNAPAPASQKHVVVNADESEPGTFKDRTIMEGDPFSLIEAATLIGYIVGAENGWILIRGEYPRSFRRLQAAIAAARSAGYLGRDILGREGFHFDIELRLGAGAYICGEETALFEAVEGKRGFPRIKPPFPTTHGLFGQPTAINNVETLVMALAAFNAGEEAWNQMGTKQSPGTKLFCVSGHVEQPGTYEVPFGLTIRQLLEMAGGVRGGKQLKGCLVGGAAGVFVNPGMIDMPLTYEDARANQVPLGSGAIVVMDESVDVREMMIQLAHFFAHESCGKCFPCQIGTQRQLEILERVAAEGSRGAADLRALQDIGATMTQTSLCGLGQTAASAIMSAVKLWPELVA